MDVELHDWEVLDDSNSIHNTSSYLDGIERDSEGIIRSDYFSLHPHNYSSTVAEDVTDQTSVDSDNPSWIDPVCDTNYSKTKPTGELWSTDGSDDGRFVESEACNNELGIAVTASRQSLSDSAKIESKPCVDEESEPESELESQPSVEEKIVVEARPQGDDEDVLAENMKPDGEERIRVAVWWKLPLDLLKYCLFKASPVWTLSVAAAMVGVAILGRRLYKMKQKTRTLQLKITVDDKKVSQVMSRAARLNEAFSVVKRGPIIRPSLPAPHWPVMALR